MSWWSRLGNVFRSRKLDHDLDDEIHFHIDNRTQDLIAKGMAPEEARRQATLAFGGGLKYRERSRDIKLLPWLDTIGRDLAFGIRMLAKNPVLTVAALISLAFAIGASATAFSLLDAVVLKQLPVSRPEQLVLAINSIPRRADKPVEYESYSYPLFLRLRDAGQPYVHLCALSYVATRPASFGGGEEKVRIQWLSGDAFSMLGIRAARGRTFTMEDDRKPGERAVAVLSYEFWSRRFGKDGSMIGKTFRLWNRSFQIVGIAQAGFSGIEVGKMPDIWVPMMMSDPPEAIAEAGWQWFRIIGRLRSGVAAEQARQVLQASFTNFRKDRALRLFAADEPAERVKQYLDVRLILKPAGQGPSTFRKDFEQPLWVFAVVVSLVLLIACSNLANLMFSMAAGREREMAVRISIGAGRRRLIQQVLLETGVLAAMASGLGLVFALWAGPFIVSLLGPSQDAVRLQLGLDWRVLGYVTVVFVLVTLLFGAGPAVRASAVEPNEALKGGDTRYSRMRLSRVLVGAQVGFCFLVLFLASLFLLTFRNLTGVQMGFDPENLTIVSVDAKELRDRGEKAAPYWQQLQERVQELPGVRSAALMAWAVFAQYEWSSNIRVPGMAPDSVEANFLPVSPGFFATMKTPLLTGRDFGRQDTAMASPFGFRRPEQRPHSGPTPAIVNQAFADRYFPHTSPVGRLFYRPEGPIGQASLQVVGVVRNMKYGSLREANRFMVFVPLLPVDEATLLIRSDLDAGRIAATLKPEISRIHPSFRIAEVTTQAKLIEDTLIRERILALLSGFLAVVAMLLAGVGLYGVLNYSVVRRTKEIGIRRALGARHSIVLRLVFSEILLTLAAGAFAGFACGLLIAPLVTSLLFAVKSTDTVTLAIPAICLVLSATFAALLPALRAIRVDPMRVLRYE